MVSFQSVRKTSNCLVMAKSYPIDRVDGQFKSNKSIRDIHIISLRTMTSKFFNHKFDCNN